MVQVSVSEGILEGEEVQNEYGGTFYSFKGIPYAAPPLGDLRFKAPQPPAVWDGVRSAKEHGPICYQKELNTGAIGGSEDCLYLNVYTPSLKPPVPLPVMVWIHGGGFICGHGNDSLYGPGFLIRHDVVIVTLNYRVEILGFLCLDTEDIPGNAGMKDQVAALRWVQKNIANFGGDPENVTIFGESAGGASVSFHLISPMSKGLFKRAIAQSGSAVNWWGPGFELRERALTYARRHGCTSEDDKVLHEFFVNQPVSNLINVKLPVTKDHKPYEISFGIADEKQFGDNERFFYGNVFDAFKNGTFEGVEVMTGFTKNEGLMAFVSTSIDEVISEANNYIEFYVPKELKMVTSIKDQVKIGKLFKEYYKVKGTCVTRDNIDDLLRYLSLDMFSHGVICFSRLISSKNTTYVYKFTCTTERNFLAHMFGVGSIYKPGMVCHADDLMYLFPFKMSDTPVEKDSETAKIIDTITTLWTNFAKFGNPTPDDSLGVKWNPFTVDQQEFLDIGSKLTPSTRPEGEDMDFWDDIFRQYMPWWFDK